MLRQWNIPVPFITQLRYGYAGTSVMSRSVRREDILEDAVERRDFQKALGEAAQRAAFELHAYSVKRPGWLGVAHLLGGVGIAADTRSGRRQFERRMERRRTEQRRRKRIAVGVGPNIHFLQIAPEDPSVNPPTQTGVFPI